MSESLFKMDTVPQILGRKRKAWTKSQTDILTKSFQSKVYPARKEILQLAKSLSVSEIRVENWFGTKRHKERRKGTLAKGEQFSVVHVLRVS